MIYAVNERHVVLKPGDPRQKFRDWSPKNQITLGNRKNGCLCCIHVIMLIKFWEKWWSYN